MRAAVAAILGSATFVFAAPAFAADAGSTEQLEEVQVTGTRIKRANDFDTANPTTVVDSDYIKNLGIVNVGDASEVAAVRTFRTTRLRPPATPTSSPVRRSPTCAA